VIQFRWRSGSRFGSGSPKSEIRIRRITRKLVNGFWRIFWKGRAWLKDQVIQFWWRSGSRFGSGVQSLKSGSSGSAEVCSLCVHSCFILFVYLLPWNRLQSIWRLVCNLLRHSAMFLRYINARPEAGSKIINYEYSKWKNNENLRTRSSLNITI